MVWRALLFLSLGLTAVENSGDAVIRYRDALLQYPLPPNATTLPYKQFQLCGANGVLGSLSLLKPVYCRRLCNYSYPERDMADYVAAIKAGFRGDLVLQLGSTDVQVVGGYPPGVKLGLDWATAGQRWSPGYPLGLPGHQHGRGKTRINNHLQLEITYRECGGDVTATKFTAIAHTFRHTAATCHADDNLNANWHWDPLERPLHQEVFPNQRIVYSFSVAWVKDPDACPDRSVKPKTANLQPPSKSPSLALVSTTEPPSDPSLPSAYLPFCAVSPEPVVPGKNVVCKVLCQVTYTATQMAAIIVQIKRDARAQLQLGGVDAMEATNSTTGSPVLLRGWPVGIRGHINGHHNARLNNHIALTAVVSRGGAAEVRSLQVVPHSTRLSSQCTTEDTANDRAHWAPNGAGPLAQRASAGQAVYWTYSLTWQDDAGSGLLHQSSSAANTLEEAAETSPKAPTAAAATAAAAAAVIRPPTPADTSQEDSLVDTASVAHVAEGHPMATQGTPIPLSGGIVALVAIANLVILRRAYLQAQEVQSSRRTRTRSVQM